MLELYLGNKEYFDSQKEEFIYLKGKLYRFEHSLEAISKWESKWHKPYLSRDEKTPEEALDYIRTMCLDGTPPLEFLDNQAIEALTSYINDPQTATTIKKDNTPASSKVLTSEVIYGYMATAQVPFECDKWHINRLLTLLEVISSFNDKPKKMSPDEVRAQNARINAERKKQLNTKG